MTKEPAMPFTIVDLEQGTEVWREWRYGGVGASDAPAIMRENPWKSLAQLRAEREFGKRPASQTVRSSRAMARGVALEPEARAAYNRLTGHSVFPLCLQSNAHEWMRCSLDGICLDTGTAVEIKCGTGSYNSTAKNQRVPRHYYGQLQHTLAVTGFAAMDFFCYLPGRRPITINCARDEKYIERLISAEARFWESLGRG
ncbi:hypothetical protein GCM10023115_10380 [Pontixanthobacter gangjinensis]